MLDSAFLYDSNIWVALTFPAHPGHSVASQHFANLADQQTAYFCRSTEQSFLRLITTPSVYNYYGVTGITNAIALETLEDYYKSPRVRYSTEPSGVQQTWHNFAKLPTSSPKVWMDAFLAAFAVEAKLTLVTLDRDFQAYTNRGLKLELLTIP